MRVLSKRIALLSGIIVGLTASTSVIGKPDNGGGKPPKEPPAALTEPVAAFSILEGKGKKSVWRVLSVDANGVTTRLVQDSLFFSWAPAWQGLKLAFSSFSDELDGPSLGTTP